jgi:hypothetical protein
MDRRAAYPSARAPPTRRERQRPRRELRERARLGVAVAVAQDELRRERERGRQQLAGADARGVRGGVGGDDARRAAAAADDQRSLDVGHCLRAREDVERQRGEEEAGPERHIAFTCHPERSEGSR